MARSRPAPPRCSASRRPQRGRRHPRAPTTCRSTPPPRSTGTTTSRWPRPSTRSPAIASAPLWTCAPTGRWCGSTPEASSGKPTPARLRRSRHRPRGPPIGADRLRDAGPRQAPPDGRRARPGHRDLHRRAARAPAALDHDAPGLGPSRPREEVGAEGSRLRAPAPSSTKRSTSGSSVGCWSGPPKRPRCQRPRRAP